MFNEWSFAYVVAITGKRPVQPETTYDRDVSFASAPETIERSSDLRRCWGFWSRAGPNQR